MAHRMENIFSELEYEEETFNKLRCAEQGLHGREFYDCTFSDCSFREATLSSCKFDGCTLSLIHI